MKPDFATMSRAQLKDYVLKHREDTEAFQALADKILAAPNLKWYNPEEADRFPEILAEKQKKHQELNNSERI